VGLIHQRVYTLDFINRIHITHLQVRKRNIEPLAP